MLFPLAPRIVKSKNYKNTTDIVQQPSCWFYFLAYDNGAPYVVVGAVVFYYPP